jgi:hypothetical protein
MGRRLAAFTLIAAAACATGRSADPPAGAASMAPRLARYADRIVLSWLEPDAEGVPALRFAVREGQGWSAPGTAIREAGLAGDAADVPSVVPVGGGGLAAHWTVKRGASKDARDLMVSVSRDGGVSWTKPARPHRDDTNSEHGMATLVPAGDDGAFGICWLDGRAGAKSEYGDGGTALYWADWSGSGFGDERLLDERVCDCCKTGAARGASGPVVAYRDRSVADMRDVSVIRRDGMAWSAPQPVHADGWILTACPTNGPSIAIRGERAAVAWFTGANATPSVWASLSSDGGKTLGPPIRIDAGAPVGRVDATMLPDGSAAVAWLERKGPAAEVRVRRIAPDGRLSHPVVVAKTSPARSSGYPSIVEEGDKTVLLAWTESGTPGRIHAASITLP